MIEMGKLLSSVLNNFSSNQEERTETLTIDLNELDILKIYTDEADVETFFHDKPRIDLKLETFENGPKLTFEKTGSHVRIVAKTPEKSGGIKFFNSKRTTALQVTLPKYFMDTLVIKTKSGDVDLDGMEANQINLHTVSGDIKSTNLKAKETAIHSVSGDLYIRYIFSENIHVKTTSGDMDIKGIYGNMKGTTVSGDLLIEQCKGEKMQVSTVSGDVKVTICQVTDLEVRTQSGDIEGSVLEALQIKTSSASGDIQYRNCTGHVDAKSNSGDVDLYLKCLSNIQASNVSGDINVKLDSDETDVDVELKTASGDITSNLPIRYAEKSDRRMVGSSGSGKYTIKVNTTSGDINLRKSS